MNIHVLHEENGLMTTINDSGLDLGMAFDPEMLNVIQSGEVTIIGFGEHGARDTTCITAYYEKIVEMLTRNECRVLIFDMRNVWFLPSKVLGALLAFRKFVERIELHNLSDEVHEVLRVTQLDQVFHIDEAG